ECRGHEPELGGGSLDDGRDIAGGETPIRDALRALVEDTTEDSALGDPGSVEPRSQRGDRARDLATRDRHHAAEAFLVGLGAANSYPQAFGRLFEVLDVERHNLGAAEGAREPYQNDGAVAERAKRPPRCAQSDDHVRGGGSVAHGGRASPAPPAVVAQRWGSDQTLRPPSDCQA